MLCERYMLYCTATPDQVGLSLLLALVYFSQESSQNLFLESPAFVDVVNQSLDLTHDVFFIIQIIIL